MTDASPPASALPPVDPTELATLVAAKLGHDFISPSGAIVSGLDLMKDPASPSARRRPASDSPAANCTVW